MTTLNANGRAARKSLADQIDRLDCILDGLAESLNEAVATSVKEAVQAVIKELLANEHLRKRLLLGRAAADPNAGNRLGRPGFLTRLAKHLWSGSMKAARTAWGWGATGLARLCGGTFAGMRHASQQAVALTSNVGTVLFGVAWLANEFRKPLLVAVGVGIVVGLSSYLAGPVVASLGCGLAGFVGSLVASALNSLRRVLTTDLQSVG